MRHSSDEFSATRGARPAKPAIWAEGRQQPRFDLPSFLRVAGDRARGAAAASLDRLAGGTARLGQRVGSGALRVPEARLGRLGRALPSHQAVARQVIGLARLVAEAGRRAAGSGPVEPLAFRGWEAALAQPVVTRVPGRPQPPAPAPPAVTVPDAAPEATATAAVAPMPEAAPVPAKPQAPEADAATLAAIRSAIRTAAVEPRRPRSPGPHQPVAEPPAPAAGHLEAAMPRGGEALPDLAPGEPPPPGLLFRAGATALAAVAVAIAWPWGALRAGALHAQGTDLRLID